MADWLAMKDTTRRRLAAILVAVLLAAAGTACGKPGYVVDAFPEMHYQSSYRSQEPPRLYPPSDSVPVGGREIAYTFEEAGVLSNPFLLEGETRERAAELFQTNCQFCHGSQGRGDGPIAEVFRAQGVPTPVDLAGARVAARNDGQRFWLITNGVGLMPPFDRLLTEEERWLIVAHVRMLSGPSLTPQ